MTTWLTALLLIVQASTGAQSKGATRAEIRAAYGEPDLTFKSKPDLVSDKHVAEVWEYGVRSIYDFPYRRTVYFDGSGKVLKVFDSPKEVPLSDDEIAALNSLDHASGVMGQSFDPVTVVAAAKSLWSLGKTDAIRVVRYYLEARPIEPAPDERGGIPFSWEAVRDFEDYRVSVVLWMMFPPEMNPGLPGPTFLTASAVPALLGTAGAMPLFVTHGAPIMLSGGIFIHDSLYQDRLLEFCEKNGHMVADPPRIRGSRREVEIDVDAFLHTLPKSNAFFNKMIESQLARIPD